MGSNYFLEAKEKLEIEDILGLIEPQEDEKPLLFLVRNKFSKN